MEPDNELSNESGDQFGNKVKIKFKDEDNFWTKYRLPILISAGVLIVAGIVIVVVTYGKDKKDTFDLGQTPSSILNESQTNGGGEAPIFSPDISSWNSYYWPEKVSTKYPSDWKLEEIEFKSAAQEQAEEEGDIELRGEIVGLKIIPATNNSSDEIFIGGRFITCADVKNYSTNRCLKNKISVPFYTNSQNEEVLKAFDLIFGNTLLIEESK